MCLSGFAAKLCPGMCRYLDFRLGATEIDRSLHRCRMRILERVAHEVERPYGVNAWLNEHRLAFTLGHAALGPPRQIRPKLAVLSPAALKVSPSQRLDF